MPTKCVPTMKGIKSVSNGDYYLVKSVDKIDREEYDSNTFYKFGIDGNT